MKLTELTDWLDAVFAVCPCDDYSNNGLQVEGAAEVSKVAFAVDACLETINRAAAAGADMLVCHHGLSWGNGFKRLVGMEADRYRQLFNHGLSLYAMHLPLDAHPQIGNNAVLAQRLHCPVTSWFCDYHGINIGTVCRLEHRRSLVEVLADVRKTISQEAWLTDNTHGVATTLGFVSGGGDFAIDLCRQAGVDCLVTGEFLHQRWHNARELGISVITAGHYNTENTGIQALMSKFEKELSLQTLLIEAPTGL